MSTHNPCFEEKSEKYQNFLSENFQFLVVKFSVYLNRRVFVMIFVPSGNCYSEVSLYLSYFSMTMYVVGCPRGTSDENLYDFDAKSR